MRSKMVREYWGEGNWGRAEAARRWAMTERTRARPRTMRWVCACWIWAREGHGGRKVRGW